MDQGPALYLCAAAAYDAAALATLRADSLMEMGFLRPEDRERFTIEARGELYRMLRTEQIAAWLLVDHERAVGCAVALFWSRLPYPNGMTHAEIAGVYVKPEYRRQGFARELIEEAIAATRARGARSTVLHARPGTEDFYRRLGFLPSNEMILTRGTSEQNRELEKICSVI